MTDNPQATERTRASLELLYSISRELTSELDLRELLQRILRLTLAQVEAFSGSIIVLDEQGLLTNGAVAYNGEVLDGAPEQLHAAFKHGLAGWVFEHRDSAFVPSTFDDERWLQKLGDRIDDTSRSAISVPLIVRDRVVGVLTMVHPEAEHFNQDHLTLLQAIADQAGIAVENARLFSAEQERRRFASTLQEIARTINSTLDPAYVFSLILEQLERLIDYDSSSIFLIEDDKLVIVAARGFQDDQAILGVTLPINGDLLCCQVLRTLQVVVSEDVQKDGGWLQTDELVESKKIHGWIGAPLIVQDQAVGVLNVDSRKVGAYGSVEAEVVAAFADQAAAAVANTKLFAESQRRVQALAAIASTAREVTASLDLDDVLKRILAQTMGSMEAEGASLALLNEETNKLEFRFASGQVAADMLGVQLDIGQGIAGWVVENNEPLVVPDVQEDPRFYPRVDEKTGFETRVVVAAPISIQSKTIGVLEAINPRWGSVMQEQIDLMMGIAYLAGTAIKSARLFAETQDARQRYASLFEDSSDPILITDLQGVIADANRRAKSFLDVDCETLIGNSVQHLKIPKIDQLLEALTKLEPGQTYFHENRDTELKDDNLPIDVHVKRIDIGQEAFLQWILRDISERIELDKLRSDLTSMIFHDLRAPLGNIISSLEVMRATAPADDDTFHSILSIAQRSSRRASRLVESLLDIDRLEAGRAVLDKTTGAMDVLITESVEEVHPTAEAKGHLVRFELSPGLPDVEVDMDMIRRVLINLLENAIKYTPADGRITISARKEDKHILIAVSDSGQGIPVSDQQRIFEKYARVRRGSRSKGIGLGLAFCRLAVEAHGGRIWVESNQGQGSSFFFTLPL